MGVLLAIGFTIIGLKFGLIIGLVVGILNIVPYLGTIIGLVVAVPLAFFQTDGGWRLVGLVLVVKIIVQTIEGWVLTPKIMGERTGLHPVTIIFSIFFWGTAFGGVLGMLLAIPLTAFFVTAWRLAKRKYFHAPDAQEPASLRARPMGRPPSAPTAALSSRRAKACPGAGRTSAPAGVRIRSTMVSTCPTRPSSRRKRLVVPHDVSACHGIFSSRVSSFLRCSRSEWSSSADGRALGGSSSER